MVGNYWNENLTKITANNKPVDVVKGIGPKYKEELNKIGIKTTNDLISRALKAKDRRKLFSETDLSLSDLYEWAGMASLMKVSGIGPKYAKLLSKAQIENLGQLANQKSVVAARSLDILKEENPKAMELKPSEKTLASWIDEARILFNELELQKSDVEDLTPATLRELDYKIHDFLNFQSWDSFIRLGNFLQGLAISKIREFRMRNQLREKLHDVNVRSKKNDQRQDRLKDITKHLTELGESKEGIDKFIKDLKQGKFDKYPMENYLENSSYSKDEYNFVVFIGALGCYLNALGRIYNCPKSEKDFLAIVMDRKVRLEETGDSIPKGENIDITQEDVDAAHDKIYSKLLASLGKQVNEMDMEIDDILNDIYNCLVAKQIEKLEETTAVNLWRLDKQLEKFFKIEYRIWALIHQLPNPPAENIHLAVKLNALLERVVILYGICLYYMAINYNSRLGASNLLKEEIHMAKKTVFESQLPKRDFFPLSELLEETGKFKKSVIETCGKVKFTKEWRKSDEAGFILQQDENEVDVILKGCERKDMLPPEDSFVLLSGELKNTRKGLIIEVEKFGFGSLKKQSWLDHTMELKNDFWHTGNYAIKSDRFLRFPESARWIIRMYGGGTIDGDM